jgi:hypothetical protein
MSVNLVPSYSAAIPLWEGIIFVCVYINTENNGFFPLKNNWVTLLPSQNHGYNLLTYYARILIVNHAFILKECGYINVKFAIFYFLEYE